MRTLRELKEYYNLKLDDRRVCEMSNLQPKDTGLKPILHVMWKGGAKHGPRVKVSNIVGTFHPTDNFTVTAEHEPRVVGNCKLRQDHLNDIIDWVKLNHSHIHHVWHHGEIMSGTEIDAGFKRI